MRLPLDVDVIGTPEPHLKATADTDCHEDSGERPPFDLVAPVLSPDAADPGCGSRQGRKTDATVATADTHRGPLRVSRVEPHALP